MPPFIRKTQTLNSLRRVLATSEVAVKGEVACIDTSTGNFVVAQSGSTTLIPVGTFTESFTGDGTRRTTVALFAELRVQELLNADAPNDVSDSDCGSSCYWLDGRTVTMASSGNSRAGIVLGLDGERVVVATALNYQGATGASGRTGSVATRTALAAITAASRADGDLVTVRSDGSNWRFSSASTLAEDGLTVEGSNIVIEPDAGTGRWLRQDQVFVARIPIAFGTADAAQLMVVPAGYSVKIIDDPSWDVTTGFTGGTSSAIGISSSNAGSSTKGDLLGGATGDVTATLGTAGVKQGTVGARMDSLSERRAARIEATEHLRFDRITSAFTAGAGFVNVPMALERVG